MKRSQTEKLVHKREALVSRTARALNISVDDSIKLLSVRKQQSIRINNLKSSPSLIAQLKDSGWAENYHEWFSYGIISEHELSQIRDSHLVKEGHVYIQNAASWIPVLALDPKPGEAVLDVCAAPGGKTSHIAAHSGNKVLITANDNSRTRLTKLRNNMDRLGVSNVTYTLFDATRLASKMPGQQFDKILLDAPCSGEGMMSYDTEKDFATWSVAHIRRLQALQKKLILQAWELLKPGGVLIYSTCTIAPEENEAVINYFLRKRDNASIETIDIDLPNQVGAVTNWNDKQYDSRVVNCIRLKPSKYIEAFFVCKLKKQQVD